MTVAPGIQLGFYLCSVSQMWSTWSLSLLSHWQVLWGTCTTASPCTPSRFIAHHDPGPSQHTHHLHATARPSSPQWSLLPLTCTLLHYQPHQAGTLTAPTSPESSSRPLWWTSASDHVAVSIQYQHNTYQHCLSPTRAWREQERCRVKWYGTKKLRLNIMESAWRCQVLEHRCLFKRFGEGELRTADGREGHRNAGVKRVIAGWWLGLVR